MPTLATQGDLEALRGPAYIKELLAEAYQPSNTQPEKDTLAQARLDAALASGDSLIRQFLDVGFDWALVDADAKTVLLEFARDEAVYQLKANSKAGTDEQDEQQATRRRKDLGEMRNERKQWTGNTAVQSPIAGEFVASASRFARDRLAGLT